MHEQEMDINKVKVKVVDRKIAFARVEWWIDVSFFYRFVSSWLGNWKIYTYVHTCNDIMTPDDIVSLHQNINNNNKNKQYSSSPSSHAMQC